MNGAEDAVMISGVYFSVETPSKLVLREMAYLIVEYVGKYTIQAGRVQEGRGGETTPYRRWEEGETVR